MDKFVEELPECSKNKQIVKININYKFIKLKELMKWNKNTHFNFKGQKVFLSKNKLNIIKKKYISKKDGKGKDNEKS
ncbi:MAG: hypothetical protein IKG14_01480 [Clostridia bacterium]|nr:hypothetical protein [Clostridia bacterium]